MSNLDTRRDGRQPDGVVDEPSLSTGGDRSRWPWAMAFVALVFVALVFAAWGWGFGFDGRHRVEGVAGAGSAAPLKPLGPIGAGSDSAGKDGGVGSAIGTVTGNANTGR